VRLFVQTTKSKNEYDKIVTLIMQKLKSTDHMVPDFKYYNTICGQVSQRIPKLIKFCLENEVIIFISGKNSSNGSQLFSVCKSENNKSYFISNENDIKPDWFIATKSVGISGATSTPVWLMKKIADQISNY
jgi:4-hydroxy-3-methylbut-2-en-1-yl diphosphate reductase